MVGAKPSSSNEVGLVRVRPGVGGEDMLIGVWHSPMLFCQSRYAPVGDATGGRASGGGQPLASTRTNVRAGGRAVTGGQARGASGGRIQGRITFIPEFVVGGPRTTMHVSSIGSKGRKGAGPRGRYGNTEFTTTPEAPIHTPSNNEDTAGQP